ncbi:MAG: hypothetical protein NZM11_12460, partial [Anaerolineales bacterium]|nr:hypothetical protein [Anaerolineales bacterium]
MASGMVAVVIDTDVLLLAFAFQADKRQTSNTRFLTRVRPAQPAITIYNLMELLGQLSFNLSPVRIETFGASFRERTRRWTSGEAWRLGGES